MTLLRRSLIAATALSFAAVVNAQTPTPAPAEDPGPKVGEMAPDFTLPGATKDGLAGPVKLSDLRGQVVVLAFFPRSRTQGCTAQMESYRDQYATLFNGGNGVKVFGVSTDADTMQRNWAQEKNFPVTFLSDVEGGMGASYNVLRERNGTKLFGRVLFVVGKDGRITHVMRPFRELSADAYTELGEAVAKARGG